MTTVITHALVGLLAAKAIEKPDTPKRFMFLALVCPMIPDLDIIGYNLFYIPIGHTLGHRGFFHSPIFCLVLALLITSLFFYHNKIFSKTWFRTVLFFFLVLISHGLLDALTNRGLGVAFLSPFSNARFFFPWRPIEISPLSIQAFLGSRGLRVFSSELLWIWLPAFSFSILAGSIKRHRNRNQPVSMPTI